MQKVFCDGLDIIKDGKYFRVVIKLGTHTLHTEKLNKLTAKAVCFKIRYGVEWDGVELKK
jgi:hypothetical protein